MDTGNRHFLRSWWHNFPLITRILVYFEIKLSVHLAWTKLLSTVILDSYSNGTHKPKRVIPEVRRGC